MKFDSQRSIQATLNLVLAAVFSFALLKVYLIPRLEELFDSESSNLIEFWWLNLIGYLLIASCVCFAVHIFKPLNSWRESGLIMSLMIMLTGSSIAGIFLNLAMGVVNPGFSIGQGLFLIIGVTAGLIQEFE